MLFATVDLGVKALVELSTSCWINSYSNLDLASPYNI